MSKDDEIEMSANGQPPSEPMSSERSQRVLKVTPGLLAEFLNKVAPDAKCTYCGQAEYFVPTDPNGESAALVTAAVPHVKGIGAWMYMLICPNCGHTALFNAHHIAPKIIEDD